MYRGPYNLYIYTGLLTAIPDILDQLTSLHLPLNPSIVIREMWLNSLNTRALGHSTINIAYRDVD